MYCRICGDEREVAYRPAKRQTLCASCNRETPAKVGREYFDAHYWVSDDPSEGKPNEMIRREFYADYLASNMTFEEYVESTVDPY